MLCFIHIWIEVSIFIDCAAVPAFIWIEDGAVVANFNQ